MDFVASFRETREINLATSVPILAITVGKLCAIMYYYWLL